MESQWSINNEGQVSPNHYSYLQPLCVELQAPSSETLRNAVRGSEERERDRRGPSQRKAAGSHPLAESTPASLSSSSPRDRPTSRLSPDRSVLPNARLTPRSSDPLPTILSSRAPWQVFLDCPGDIADRDTRLQNPVTLRNYGSRIGPSEIAKFNGRKKGCAQSILGVSGVLLHKSLPWSQAQACGWDKLGARSSIISLSSWTTANLG